MGRFEGLTGFVKVVTNYVMYFMGRFRLRGMDRIIARGSGAPIGEVVVSHRCGARGRRIVRSWEAERQASRQGQMGGGERLRCNPRVPERAACRSRPATAAGLQNAAFIPTRHVVRRGSGAWLIEIEGVPRNRQAGANACEYFHVDRSLAAGAGQRSLPKRPPAFSITPSMFDTCAMVSAMAAAIRR